jgi:hypothetical protein
MVATHHDLRAAKRKKRVKSKDGGVNGKRRSSIDGKLLSARTINTQHA